MKTGTRIILTALILLVAVASLEIAAAIASPLAGAVTAAQVRDSITAHATSKLIGEGIVPTTIILAALAALLVVWLRPIQRLRGSIAALMLLAAALLTSCGPPYVRRVVEIKSNETAWVIPLDGKTKDLQAKFNSVDFLDQKKVPLKRIMVEQVERSTGRMWWDYEWLDAARVVVVDRSLVTREWTDEAASGTRRGREGIGVVTGDSVKLRLGLTITASIDEDDASTYLYFHGARPLAEVLDQNVRSFAVSELTKEVAAASLTEVQGEIGKLYDKLFDDARKVFKAKGITIQYLGNSEGLTYEDPKVQQAINQRYLAEQDALTARQEQEAQKVRNATRVLNAQAEADAAQKLFAAKEASTFQNDLSIRMKGADAQLHMAQRWNGSMPLNILPANSPLLMNLGGGSR